MKAVRMRTQGSKDYKSWALWVPKEIGDLLAERFAFRPELTEEGILYRPIPLDEADTIDTRPLPDWAKP